MQATVLGQSFWCVPYLSPDATQCLFLVCHLSGLNCQLTTLRYVVVWIEMDLTGFLLYHFFEQKLLRAHHGVRALRNYGPDSGIRERAVSTNVTVYTDLLDNTQHEYPNGFSQNQRNVHNIVRQLMAENNIEIPTDNSDVEVWQLGSDLCH